MISLIKNELYKIIKKKSFLVILLITIGMMALSNFLTYKYSNDGTIEYSVSIGKEQFDDDPIQDKIFSESEKLIKKYGEKSWQSFIVEQYFNAIAYDYYSCLDKCDNEELLDYKNKYDSLLKKLENDDWHSFAEEDKKEHERNLKYLEEQLAKTTSKSEIRDLEYQINTSKNNIYIASTMLEKNIPYGNNFLYNTLTQIQIIPDYDYFVQNYDYSYGTSAKEEDMKREYERLVENNELNKYVVNNNKDIFNTSNLRGTTLHVLGDNMMFIIIFIIMIAGSIVSNEYSKGTIKSLLTRPYSRTKILLSKYISCLIMLLLFVLIIVLFQLLCGGLFFSFDSLNIPYVGYDFTNSTIITMNLFKYLLIEFINYLPMIILLMTLSFGVSTILGNTSVSIVVGILGFIGSSIINMFYQSYETGFLRYFVTPNWDLNEYLFGKTSSYNNLSLNFSIIICVIYFLIMMITTFIIFKKKNIKNI